MSDKLTPKQEMFCKEYLIDLNATQAAIRAGYSEKTANEQGTQNLVKLSIQDRVQQLLDDERPLDLPQSAMARSGCLNVGDEIRPWFFSFGGT